MKVVASYKTESLIRFDRDEEVISSLVGYCKKEKIYAGYFTAIGAASEVIVSFYNLKSKKYQDKTFKEEVEIVSVTGNIARVGKELRIHAHGSFAKDDYSMFGGHLQKLVVSATCEVHLTKLKGKMMREFDEETGLFLLK